MIRLSSMLVLLAAASPALAQDDEEGRNVKYKDRTEIDFEAVDVTGELVKPQGSLINDRRKASFNPLITLREEFNAEMKASISEIQ